MLSDVNKLLKTKSLLTTPSNVLPLHLKQTFPRIIWILNECECDGIESRIPFKMFSTLLTIICIAIAKFARKWIPILKLNTSLKSCTIRLVETWSWNDCLVVYCKKRVEKFLKLRKGHFDSKIVFTNCEKKCSSH